MNLVSLKDRSICHKHAANDPRGNRAAMSMPQEGHAVKQTEIETGIFAKTRQISYIAFWILRGFIFPTEIFQTPSTQSEAASPEQAL